MNIKGKVTMGALLLALTSGGTYVVASQTAQTVNDAINTVTAHSEEMHKIAVKERQVEVNALAAQLAIEAESARLDLVAKEAELARERAVNDARAVHTLNRDQELAWVWTGSKGLLYGLVGVVPTAVGGLVLWRVIAVKRREDEDRKLVQVVANGAMPVSREFLLSHPEALFEMVQIKAEQAARIEIARAAQINLPALTTYTNSPSSTYSPTNDKDLLLTAKEEEVNQAAASSVGADSNERSQIIRDALRMQDVPVDVWLMATGPQVETYAIKPGIRVKGRKTKLVMVKEVIRHEEDIALALDVEDIGLERKGRIIACEVEREKRQFVSLADMFTSKEWKAALKEMELPLALGVDTVGENVVIDFAEAPHMLAAGATNMGKSVVIRSVITSLCQQSPERVRLTLIDPKQVEFFPFKDLPHVTRVITDMDQAAGTLAKAIAEMERRGSLFKDLGVQKITQYNKKSKTPLPYIIIIVDELADLMHTHSDEVEETLERLAQKARAAGIHLILATQRPAADVIPGIIRSNIGMRLAVRTVSGGDSRIILDDVGAEKLLDRGDALLKLPQSKKMTRLQTSFIETSDAERLILAQSANNPVSEEKTEGRNWPETGRKLGENWPETNSREAEPKEEPEIINYAKADPETRANYIKMLHAEGLNPTQIQVQIWGSKGGRRNRERRDEIERAIADSQLNGHTNGNRNGHTNGHKNGH